MGEESDLYYFGPDGPCVFDGTEFIPVATKAPLHDNEPCQGESEQGKADRLYRFWSTISSDTNQWTAEEIDRWAGSDKRPSLGGTIGAADPFGTLTPEQRRALDRMVGKMPLSDPKPRNGVVRDVFPARAMR